MFEYFKGDNFEYENILIYYFVIYQVLFFIFFELF